MNVLVLFFAILFWFSVALIFYAYIGYPLLLSFFTAFQQKKDVSVTSEVPMTILITAYNEEAVIAKKIENTLKLEYPQDKLQIIVAADGSSDRTPEIVRGFGNRVELSYIPNRQGKMAAINRAIPLVRGEIIVFSDANNLYEADALRRLVAPFSDSKVGASTGAKLIIQDGRNLSGAEGIYWKYESWIKRNQTKLDTCTSSVGEIFAVRRDVYIPPPNFVINDDYYIVIDLIRRGFRVFYVPEARSLEYISASEQDEITRRARIGTGLYQSIFMIAKLLPLGRPWAIWHIISHKFCRALVPFGLLGALLSNLIIVLFEYRQLHHFLLSGSYMQIFLSAQLAFYMLALFGNYFKFPGFVGKLIYLCAYLVNSNYAYLRGFWGFITKKQTSVWERVQRGQM